ncbi:ESX-1 secretion-associated protein EspH [Mycolicibacterium aurum]|uniref:ESX-1 secretion-associated protein EspH n=1 Tax=Mycolicibacterium aurum TaxID=1791 RepID=A0A3S4SDU8_MYCAU|nr:hypothetical protein [Mycolicibacterium aurum]VEG50963.1 ESX-1 secretion-associated protein EspH [Mycolicibacterium aurum]
MANPPHGPHDDEDHDDLAALDYSAAGDAEGETDLGTLLGNYGAADDPVRPDPLGTSLDGEDDHAMPMFTVTNPPGTVTVTTYMDGRVRDVDLSPGAAALTEAVLADEIVVIAGLATQDARSAQYTFMLEGMREHGHDTVATRDFLRRDLDLPTPEQAQAARAELFTTRYAGEE